MTRPLPCDCPYHCDGGWLTVMDGDGEGYVVACPHGCPITGELPDADDVEVPF